MLDICLPSVNPAAAAPLPLEASENCFCGTKLCARFLRQTFDGTQNWSSFPPPVDDGPGLRRPETTDDEPPLAALSRLATRSEAAFPKPILTRSIGDTAAVPTGFGGNRPPEDRPAEVGGVSGESPPYDGRNAIELRRLAAALPLPTEPDGRGSIRMPDLLLAVVVVVVVVVVAVICFWASLLEELTSDLLHLLMTSFPAVGQPPLPRKSPVVFADASIMRTPLLPILATVVN